MLGIKPMSLEEQPLLLVSKLSLQLCEVFENVSVLVGYEDIL